MSAIQQLLTDHIDIWTAAEAEKRSGRGRASGNSASIYGIKKLRELILELAVRGKLVQQDSSDESASELLKRIQIEKAKLIAEGQIKKEKSFDPISREEIPFQLPHGWKWVRIGQIGHDWGQKIPDCDFTYIEVSAIDNQRGVISSAELVRPENAPSRARKLVKNGTLIYSTIRPYLLNIAVVEEDFLPEPIASTAFAIVHPFCAMPPRYFLFFLRSPVFVQYVESVQMGIAYPAINDRQFFSGMIPLPPIEEQHRIVAKVDELMALCDQLEAQHSDVTDAHEQLVSHLLGTLTQSQSAADFNSNWQRIATHFDTLFTTEASIDALKQNLLQLAVTGKLVAQDANDEPASELLKHIQAEKANLAPGGQVRKEKTSGNSVGAEVTFDLCDNWAWCHFGDLWESSFYGPRFGKEDYVSSGGIPTIRTTDMTSDGLIELSSPPEVMVSDDKINLYKIEYGDLLVTRSGSIGTMALYLLDMLAIPSAYLIRIRFSKLFDPRYGLLYLMSPLGQNLLGLHSTSVGVPNVNATKMALFPFPLPPIMEQKRIIEKVDELVSICDSLKFHIYKSNKFQQSLASVLVERALDT